VQCQSQRRYSGNYAAFLFDRSRLRSFVSRKANEVFYVPFRVLLANWRPRERTIRCIERNDVCASTRSRKRFVDKSSWLWSSQFRRINARSKLRFIFFIFYIKIYSSDVQYHKHFSPSPTIFIIQFYDHWILFIKFIVTFQRSLIFTVIVNLMYFHQSRREIKFRYVM